ncbi:Abi family protein [Pediococcus acidilactici]|uniref:Abi family protein n=2 Tax=Pediococcus acidilactici TaxID=1254 RepID=UPI003B42806B
MSKHKPIKFHTYPYMLDKLRKKDLIIDSNTIAIEILKTRGYYNLINKYKSEFYIPGTTRFKENTSLTDFYWYQRLEDDLRNILFKFTITFEKKVKESMAFILAKEFGVSINDYLDPYKFRNKSKAISITNNLKKSIESCLNNPTLYYKNEYGDVPPWIMLSNITLGQTRMLFSIFPKKLTSYVVYEMLPTKANDSRSIRVPSRLDYYVMDFMHYSHKDMENDHVFNKATQKWVSLLIEFYRNMFTLINEFRNNLAHGNRLMHYYSRQELKYSHISIYASEKVISKNEFFEKSLGKKDLFAFMMSLIITLDRYDSLYLIEQLSAWKATNTSAPDTKKVFDSFITSCGLPSDFIERLKKIEVEKTNKQANKEFEEKYGF